jgi:hypothetical protein
MLFRTPLWGISWSLRRFLIGFTPPAKAVFEFGDDTVAKMIELSSKPVLYRRMPFGKHKRLKMEGVPLDYLQWLSGTDLEEDLRYTIEQYLNF